MIRRPFRPRRPRPGVPQAAGVPPRVREALARAQRLMQAGQFLQAAAIYDRLAHAAYQRGRHRAGMQMDVEAARAYFRGNAAAQAQDRVRRAAQHARDFRLPPVPVIRVLDQYVRHAEKQGDATDAQAFRDEILAMFPERPQPEAPAAQTPQHKSLPGSCPACHAPLHPDDLEWVADDRVSCPFCGTIVVAQ